MNIKATILLMAVIGSSAMGMNKRKAEDQDQASNKRGRVAQRVVPALALNPYSATDKKELNREIRNFDDARLDCTGNILAEREQLPFMGARAIEEAKARITALEKNLKNFENTLDCLEKKLTLPSVHKHSYR